MKILKYVFFLILITCIAGAIYIAVQPSSYSFERSKVIEAPKELVFDMVNTYKEWPNFSPWLEQDKKATLTYNSIEKGKNSSYTWNGEILGEGKMTTVEAYEFDSITQKLEFIKPFESNSTIKWDFKTIGNKTEVTWKMSGKQDFMTKMYTAFNGSIEENTAPDFERGLFKLDSTITSNMRAYSIKINGVTEHSGGFYLYNTIATSINGMKPKMQQMLNNLQAFVKTNNINTSGNPFIIYHNWDMENNSVMFSCALPTSSKVITTDATILTGQLEPFKALKTTLNGNYSNLKEAWDKSYQYISQYNLESKAEGIAIESYLNSPENTINPANLKTELFIQLN
jgi:effector-binding domain-containing protein/ribosome-associated toxin RatA of RatAB toxin-antitoxin module